MILDFFANGEGRIYAMNKNGSCFVSEGKLLESTQSLRWLEKAQDYYDFREFTVGDFYCGAGIGAIGSKYAGFKTLYAFDNNKHAVETYNLNVEPVAFVADAKTLDVNDLPYVDVITAGFPCQPFSVAGKGLGESDPDKGNLGKVLVDSIMTLRPKAFMIENVKGLISKKNRFFFESLINTLGSSYNVNWQLVNCADYGVPQKRERVFIVGLRSDLGLQFKFPEKSHVGKHISISEAFEGLSKEPSNSHCNHNVDCGIRNDEKPYVNKIPCGGNWKDLPIEDQKSFMKKGFYSGGGRTGSLFKVDVNKPSKTILSSPMGKATAQILHYEGLKPRRFTVRESLRLQSVPDSFVFPSTVPLMKQYERCSGIPTIVSYKIMKSIKTALQSKVDK